MPQHKVRFVGSPDVLIKSKSKICLGTSLTPFVDEVFPRLSIVRMLIEPVECFVTRDLFVRFYP